MVDEVAAGVEDVDEAVAGSDGGAGGGFEGVGDEDLGAYGVDSVGDIASGEGWIGEGASEFGGGEVAIVDLDGPFAEVDGEEVGAIGVSGEGEAGVDGSGGVIVDCDFCDDYRVKGSAELAVPTGDDAVERGEEEACLGAVGQEVAGGG